MSAAKRARQITLNEMFPGMQDAEPKEQPVAPDAKFQHGGLRRQVPLTNLQQFVEEKCPGLAAEYRIRRVAQLPFPLDKKYPGLLRQVRAAATIDPHPAKFFNKKRSNPPWPLHLKDDTGLCIPRAMAVQAFGPCDTTIVHQGEPISIRPSKPLFNAETMKEGPDRINQEALVSAVVQELQGQVRQHKFGGTIYCGPPGRGKTACMIHIIARLGRKALVAVPSLNLITQTRDEFLSFCDTIRIGEMRTSDSKKWRVQDCDVVITTHDSMRVCDFDYSPFGTVMFDEVHKLISKENWKVFTKFACQHAVGLTATPENRSQTGYALEYCIGPISWFEPLRIDKTQWGQLNLCYVDLHYASEVALQMNYTKVCGELKFDLNDMYQQLATHAGRMTWLTEFIAELVAQGRQILCLGQRIALMLGLANHLKEKGIDHGLLVGESNRPEDLTPEQANAVRDRQVRIFTDRIGYQALNVVSLDTIIMLEPACAGIDSWIQRIGRTTRSKPGKQVPTIYFLLDHGVPSFKRRIDGVVSELLDFDSNFNVVRKEAHINK